RAGAMLRVDQAAGRVLNGHDLAGADVGLEGHGVDRRAVAVVVVGRVGVRADVDRGGEARQPDVGALGDVALDAAREGDVAGPDGDGLADGRRDVDERSLQKAMPPPAVTVQLPWVIFTLSPLESGGRCVLSRLV